MQQEIVLYQNSVLVEPSKEVVIAKSREIARNITDTYGGRPCAGVAAPQIGIGVRMFMALGELFINPKIVNKSKAFFRAKEGCLSLRGEYGGIYDVKRHAELTLSWQDHKGHPHIKRFTGYMAQVIQHEYDHIEGILLIDHGLRI